LSKLEALIEEYKIITEQQSSAISHGNIDLVEDLIQKKAVIINEIKRLMEEESVTVGNEVKSTVEKIRALEQENIKRLEVESNKVKQEAQNIGKRKRNFDEYKKNL
jgi:hypothetical protein